jgi:hypothetical protein
VLKKLTATGILAAAGTGVMLLGGPAHADRAVQATYPINPCYTAPGYYQPAWCANPAPAYYPSTTYYPGYPGYANWGWNRWHHGAWRYPYRFHL